MGKPFKRRKYKKITIFSIVFFLIIFSLYKMDRDLKPIVMALCDAEARIIAAETINKTIRDEFANKISYDDLMTIKTDKDGNVVMIQANTVELNRIGSDIALSVQKKILDIGVKGGSIPIGALTKNDLIAYYGPKIKFNMKPVGSVASGYRSQFEAAGINQTRHIIYLDITANVQVIIPTGRNSISITSNIPIAESIIVGKVPDMYAEFGSGMPSDGIKIYDQNGDN